MGINDFETAADANLEAAMKRRFDPEANTHYRILDASALVGDKEKIKQLVFHHLKRQVPRLNELEGYFEAENKGILSRSARKAGLADERVVHGFAEYVAQFMQGFLVGNPVKITSEVDEENAIIKEFNKENDIQTLNNELVLDLSIYGRAYELEYRSEEDQNRTALLKPQETFVIYDSTVEMKPVAAIRYIKIDDKYIISLYTSERVYTYESDLNEYGVIRALDEGSINPFSDIQIIEYQNNRFRRGDFEKVLSLIDAYDAAQSDISNYMTDLNNAMLMIKGGLRLTLEEAAKMRESNILLLKEVAGPDGRASSVDAKYIYKQYDVNGVESYKNRLQTDIHKFTNTPDLNDDAFAGTQSGESMKYKLFGLEQKRIIKETFIKKGFRKRYKLLSNILSIASEGALDINNITYTFTPNAPKSLRDEIDMFTKLGGELSDLTKLSLISVIDDPQAELNRINDQLPDVYGDIVE